MFPNSVRNITVHPGWFDLIDTSMWIIQNEFDNSKDKTKVQPTVRQIKEKFGSLRMYISNLSEFSVGVVILAEYMSAKTCMVCGDVGKTRDYKWRRTLCDEHAVAFLV
jgi:transposase